MRSTFTRTGIALALAISAASAAHADILDTLAGKVAVTW